MLQFIKSLSTRTHFSSKSSNISKIVFRSFGKANSPKDTTGKIEARQREMYNKREANKKIVEELYFPDHSQIKIQEFIEQKRIEQSEYDLENKPSGKVELDADDMKFIEEISSQGFNEEAKEKSIFYPETKEEMSTLIANVDINDKLLKFYMKYHKICNKQQIFELLDKLKANLRIQEEVQEREFEKYKVKMRQIQKISKDVQIPFKTVFLSKEEIIKHPGFQFLINNINYKAANQIYQPHTVFEMYHNLLKFDAKTFDYIDPEFLNVNNLLSMIFLIMKKEFPRPYARI